MMRILLLATLMIIASAGARAQWTGPEAIERVLPFATIELADSGQIRLAGIDTGPFVMAERERPEGAAADPENVRWSRWMDGSLAVEWRLSEQGHDRHGRPLAIVRDSTGESLQLRLLREGRAVLDGKTVPAAEGERWRAAERSARAAGLGVWLDKALIEDAASVGIWPFRFAIVEGVVRDVGGGGGYRYLNFGDDWREDFTARVPQALAKQMEKEGAALDDYMGKSVAVRGWIFQANGPMIEIVSAEQIEWIE